MLQYRPILRGAKRYAEAKQVGSNGNASDSHSKDKRFKVRISAAILTTLSEVLRDLTREWSDQTYRNLP
jgi:hypothetical protein